VSRARHRGNTAPAGMQRAARRRPPAGPLALHEEAPARHGGQFPEAQPFHRSTGRTNPCRPCGTSEQDGTPLPPGDLLG